VDQNKHPNDLILYRLRMGFSRKHVAGLLRHGNTSLLAKLEQGRSRPSLDTALKLAIIYRIPVDFLYSHQYRALRENIRSQESRLRQPQQRTLF
jgi:transcriptional regulator with XRE-family HTH domain